MLSRQAVKDRLLQILEQVDVPTEAISVTASTHLKDDLGLDSIGLVRFIMALNESFQIEIRSTEVIADHFATWGDVENFIAHKLT